jgi:hypothetical protein
MHARSHAHPSTPQVRRSFRRLQAAELSAAERQEQAVALAALHGGGGGGSGEGGDGAPDSLPGVPDAAWPLFLTGSQLLRLLDAALPGACMCVCVCVCVRACVCARACACVQSDRGAW